MSFDLLSNELIAEIFIHLETPDCRRISFCCRLFRDVVEPFLYSSFVQMRKQDMGLFLRTLIEKPHLANHLKHFASAMVDSNIYRVVQPGEFDLESYLRQPAPRQWVLEQLPKLPFWPSRAGAWHSDLCNNIYWDPLCAFILWICSKNLLSIEIDSYGPDVTDWVYYVLELAKVAEQSPDVPIVFPRLRSVALRKHDGDFSISLSSIIPYLELDAVKDFAGDPIRCESFYREGSIPDSMTFNTERLVLKYSEIPSRIMVKFGLCFHNLRHFEYDHSGNTSSRFWPSSVRKGLQNSKHCLEELVLATETQRWTPIPARPEYLLALSSEFESLRLLDVSSRAMFGEEYESSEDPVPRLLYEIEWIDATFHQEFKLDFLACQNFASSLPPKLEHLIIRGCTAGIYSFLGVLVYGRADRTGVLKKLTIEFYSKFQPGEWMEKDWYKEARRRGIEIVVIYCVANSSSAPNLSNGGEVIFL